jgi:EAL domain-containing protein (putative c-di-GMP-specific phosphodiesterase class I)
MITFNFLYSTKNNLQKSIDVIDFSDCESVLVRIHTCIHNEKNIFDLTSYIKELIPNAQIIGTSTSAIIYHGKIIPDQCLISITKIGKGSVKTSIMKCFDNYVAIDNKKLCRQVKEDVVTDTTKLMFIFFTSVYSDVYNFVESSNEIFPGVQMIGGLANSTKAPLIDTSQPSFVFTDKEVMNDGGVFATINGKDIESFTSYVTGAETIGDESVITEAFGTAVTKINNISAAEHYRATIGDVLKRDPSVANLFPFVYSENDDIPFEVLYTVNTTMADQFPESIEYNKIYYNNKDIDINRKDDYLLANHNITVGKKIKRAFIYDKKIIADNNTLFYNIQNFKKSECIFAYSCVLRSIIYSNCVKWEISPYEDTTLSGCLCTGEIAHVNGKNSFSNCTFIASVAGEKESSLPLNEFSLKNTSELSSDNALLIDYLINTEKYFEQKRSSSEFISKIRKDFENKVLFDEEKKVANLSRLLFDLKLEKIDKVCIISSRNFDVFKTFLDAEKSAGMYDFYMHGFVIEAAKDGYSSYLGENHTFFIGAPMDVTLKEFEDAMRYIYEKVGKSDYLGYTPTFEFCILTNIPANELMKKYDSALLNMRKNSQLFCVYNENISADVFFEQQIEMVKIINNAIAKDKVIPYYQGIHNNEKGKIDLYEALMRLEDDNGKIYYPNQFLDVAREFSVLYDKISFMMIKKVLNTFRDRTDSKVTMNLSITDIKNNDIVTYILDFLSKAPYPENYIFEIVENEDINDYDYISEFSSQIHKLNAKIAIDDFGSGYSNFMHIINLNFDYIKIDGEIVKDCVTNEKCESVIKMISMWREVQKGNVKVIAEYVENEEIQELIMDNNIDYSQGYYFAKPENLFNK